MYESCMMIGDIFSILIKAIWIIFILAILIAGLLALLQFIQKTLQGFFDFKFPLVGDYLEKSYRMNTDQSLIKDSVESLIKNAIAEKFQDPNEPLEIVTKVMFNSKTVYGMDKFYDVNNLSYSKSRVIAAFLIEIKNSTSDSNIFSEFLVHNLPLYQGRIGKIPRDVSESFLNRNETSKKFSSKEAKSIDQESNDINEDRYAKELDYLEARYKWECVTLFKFLQINGYIKN